MTAPDDDILKEFVAEAREHLQDIEADLLAIEDAGVDIDENKVNKVFRAAHSIKGASGFFGLDRIKELAHKAETVLDLIRSRTLVPNADSTNVLLGAFDKLREMVNDPARSASEDTSGLLASLAQLAASGGAGGGPGPLAPAPPPDASTAAAGGPATSGGKGEEYLYHLQVDLLADVEAHGSRSGRFLPRARASGSGGGLPN